MPKMWNHYEPSLIQSKDLSLFSLIMFLGTIGMICDVKSFDTSVVIAAIIMPLIDFLPLFFAVRRTNIAKKKKKLYDMACKSQWN